MHTCMHTYMVCMVCLSAGSQATLTVAGLRVPSHEIVPPEFSGLGAVGLFLQTIHLDAQR